MSRILLVDDDGDMMMLTSRWFARAGHEVLTATSGKEALSKAAAEAPDLIVLDYAMPEMDGPAVLAALREDAALKDIPVLFRTGRDDGTIAEVMDTLHPAGAVSKAEGKGALMQAVEAILG